MPTPIPPIVPPPALRSEPETFSARAEANVSFFEPLVSYLNSVVDWTAARVNEVTATAMAGDLPDISAEAGNILKVNEDGTSLDFITTTAGGITLLSANDIEMLRAVLGLNDGQLASVGQITMHARSHIIPPGKLELNGAVLPYEDFTALGEYFGHPPGTVDFAIQDWTAMHPRGYWASQLATVYGPDYVKNHTHAVSGYWPAGGGAFIGSYMDLGFSNEGPALVNGNITGNPREISSNINQVQTIAVMFCIQYAE